MRNRVAITGIGCISSLGFTGAAFRDALLEGRTGIAPITSFDTTGCRSHTAGKLQGFDPASYINPAKLRRIDEVGRVAIAACGAALEDAGLGGRTGGFDRVGLALGSYTAGVHSTVDYLDSLIRSGPTGAPALIFSNTVGNAAASLCAIEFGLRGPNATFSVKEASAGSAVAYAAQLIRRGRAGAMLSGGADDIHERFFRVHDTFPVLSPLNGGEEQSRPFDRRRNGFVFGEGGFIHVLENWADAEARSARIHGELVGIGGTSSPCPINAWPLDFSELARCMHLALSDADITAADVDVVFASANATPTLDRLEAEALSVVFGPRGVPVVSIKGALGEFGAVGAAGMAAALLCLPAGRLPPTVGFETPDPACPVDVRAASRPARGGLALVNTFGSGGTNHSIVLRASSCGIKE